MSRRTTVATAALVAGAAAAAVVVVALRGAAADAEGGSAQNRAMPPATARVTRGTLVDTETHNGRLGYGEPVALAARAPGTVTALPAEGATLQRGDALARIDDDPVTLLYGTLPAYREMRPGVSGPDVTQLEKNLRALGYTGFTVDDDYTWATAAAVRDWQDDLGRSETGRVGPEQIIFAAGEVRVDSRAADVGAIVQPGAELVRTTGTVRVATVDLDTDDQRLARAGAPVEVTLPDGTAVTAKITSVRTSVTPAEEPAGEDSTTITVTATVPAAADGLDRAAVRVAFTVSEREDVLAVPVGALLALAEGGYGLEVVDGGTTRVVAVETGLFAGGKVEVTGPGIADGTVVGVAA